MCEIRILIHCIICKPNFLYRSRKDEENAEVNKALMITMAGIASGMQNTG